MNEDDERSPAAPMSNDENASPSPPPRLMITKMVLENFKSYAGIKEIGPFHKCFSSVVGPNGSGKSNVIDALLFVFGKRAKKLRLNKVSELIHNSSMFKDHPLQFARVSVHFQDIVDTGEGDDDYEILPNSEIVVSRIARRDNSSGYKLGKKNCSFKEVAAYLNSKGIDLDNNRFLILQGEVEMISLMPPKGKTEEDDGLLEYLEDIIGSNKFLEETNIVAAKVETLTEQRQERLNRVKAVEKEKDGLQGAKVEAEALLSKEREIRKKQNILYQLHLSELSAELEGFTEQKQSLQNKLKEERLQLKESSTQIQETEKELEKQTKEYDEFYKELKKTKNEFAAYERNEIKIREEIKHLKDKTKKLSKKVKTETENEKEALQKGEEATESIPDLEKEVESLTRNKGVEDAKLEKIYEKMKEKTSHLRQKLEQKTQELSPIEQEQSVFQAALDTASMEVKLMEDSTSRAKQQLQSAEKELASLDETQGGKKHELKGVEKELRGSNKRLEEAKKEEVELGETEKDLAAKNADLLSRAEEAKASLRSSSSRSKALQGILKASKKGGELSRAGVLGRLGDLAAIAEKYDVAISTACGMLDHIVVQNTQGAQLCLDFLRKYDLGRANFIPLDKMKKAAHERSIETPENAKRLFDCIAPSSQVILPALFLAVGNTLVAPDLETASRWAYDFGRRWRVVTLDGKLIETSGTMSGGGKSVQRGGMRLSSKTKSSSSPSQPIHNEEEDCGKLQALAEATSQELQRCRAKRRALAEEIRTLQKRIKYLTVQIPKLQMEIEGCDVTREELTKRLPELREQSILSKDDAQKIKDLNKKVDKCKEDMAASSQLVAKLRSEKSKLQKAIKDAGGPELKKQQQLCDQSLEQLNEASKELNTAKVTVTSSKKAATKARKALETSQKELESNEKSLEKSSTKLTTLQEKALSTKEAYELLRETETQKSKALKEKEKECEEIKQSQSKLKCAEVELVAQIDGLQRQVKDCDKRIKHWGGEVAKLQQAEEEDEIYDVSDDEAEEEEEQKEEAAEIVKEENAMDCEEEPAKRTTRSKKEKKEMGSLPTYTPAALQQYNQEEVKQSIEFLEKERQTLAKNANLTAIAEYRKKELVYLTRVAELDEITQERNEARKHYEELRRKRLEMFMDGFSLITLKLKEMYQMITLGGDAELELVDSLDPFAEGIVFSVRPPKKSWKNIANLSGGEKTLSSLALVFALHHYKPTPLYVMDEIDAALDFKNVSIVANYIKERTKNAQFIIISLRNNMFELADRLVGIYKTNNCTKSVTIDPKAFGRQREAPVLADKTNSATEVY